MRVIDASVEVHAPASRARPTPSAQRDRGLDRRHVAHRDARSSARRAARGRTRRRAAVTATQALAAGRRERRVGAPAAQLVGREVREAAGRPTRRSRARSSGRRRRPRRRARPRSASAVSAGARQRARERPSRSPVARAVPRAPRPARSPRSVSGGSARPSASRCRLASVWPWRTNVIIASPAHREPAACAGTRRGVAGRRARTGPTPTLASGEPGRLEQHDERDRREQRVVGEVRAEQRPPERRRRAGTRPRARARRTMPIGRQMQPAPQQAVTARSSTSITSASTATATKSECPYAMWPNGTSISERQQRAERDQPVVEAAALEDRRPPRRSTARRTRATSRRFRHRPRRARRSRARRLRCSPRAGRAARSTSSYSREQRHRLVVERAQVRVLHPVPALELADHQLRVGADVHARAARTPRRPRARDERLVLGDVVRGDADALAHRRDQHRRIDGHVEHDRADRRGPGVPPRAAVALDSRPCRCSRTPAHVRAGRGSRRSCRSEHDALGALAWIRSTSVAGIVRRQPWHVLPTSRATPAPWFASRIARSGEQIGRDRPGRRAPGLELLGELGVDHGFLLDQCGTRGVGDGPESATRGLDATDLGVERLLALHQLELAVVERAAVLGRGSRRRPASPGAHAGELIEPEYIVFSTSLMRAVTAGSRRRAASPRAPPRRGGRGPRPAAARARSPRPRQWRASRARAGSPGGDGGPRRRCRAPGPRGAARADSSRASLPVALRRHGPGGVGTVVAVVLGGGGGGGGAASWSWSGIRQNGFFVVGVVERLPSRSRRWSCRVRSRRRTCRTATASGPAGRSRSPALPASAIAMNFCQISRGPRAAEHRRELADVAHRALRPSGSPIHTAATSCGV